MLFVPDSQCMVHDDRDPLSSSMTHLAYPHRAARTCSSDKQYFPKCITMSYKFCVCCLVSLDMFHIVPFLDGTSPNVRISHVDKLSICCLIMCQVPCDPLIAEWKAAWNTRKCMCLRMSCSRHSNGRWICFNVTLPRLM